MAGENVEAVPRPETAPSSTSTRISGEGRRGWSPLSVALLALVAAFSAMYVSRHGIPVARDRLLLWVGLVVVAVSVRHTSAGFRSLIIDWLPFAAILLAYDLLRGAADGLLMPAHVIPQLRADEVLFGGEIPTVWLQQHLWRPPEIHWYDYGAWAVYMTHFFVTVLVALGIWLWARPLFRRYVAMVSVLAAAGFLTYALYPAAPPWLAARGGALPEVQRLIGAIWADVGGVSIGSIFEHGSRYVNNVAAVPSLHAAYSLLIVMFLWPLARSLWWRAALAAYPVLMGFALVYSGEHYAVDVFLGWLYGALSFWVVTAISRRRRATVGS